MDFLFCWEAIFMEKECKVKQRGFCCILLFSFIVLRMVTLWETRPHVNNELETSRVESLGQQIKRDTKQEATTIQR